MFGFLKKLLGLPDGINAADAQTLIKAGNAVILDVRSPAERKAAHIPGSTHIPLDELNSKASTLNLNGGISAWQSAGLPTK